MRLYNLSRLFLTINSPRLISSTITKFPINSIRWSSNKQTKMNPKDLIRLYDQHDRPIGVKLKSEAEEFAHKNKLDLIERHAKGQTKYREFVLKSRIDELVVDENVDTSELTEQAKQTSNKTAEEERTTKKPSTRDSKSIKTKNHLNELKRLTFTANISEHDFEYRFQHIRRILHKNAQIRLLITGKPNGKEHLESLYAKIQTRLGKEAKLTQKLFSGHNLKFTIQPTLEAIRLGQEMVNDDHDDEDLTLKEEQIDQEEVERLVKDMLESKK